MALEMRRKKGEEVFLFERVFFSEIKRPGFENTCIGSLHFSMPSRVDLSLAEGIKIVRGEDLTREEFELVTRFKERHKDGHKDAKSK